jgi:tetratricopeptide (TPR) repeat protein
MTKGWYGLYPRIAKAYLGLGNEPTAIRLIKAAVKAEPKWKENLSAFYCLYNHPEISSLYPVSRFTVIDWNNAISGLTDVHKSQGAISLAKKVLQKYPSSSYTWYELAKAYRESGNRQSALAADKTALKFDPENADAKRLLKDIGGQ